MNEKEKVRLAALYTAYDNFSRETQGSDSPYGRGRLAEDIASYLKELYSRLHDRELLIKLAIVNLLTPLEDPDGSDRFCKEMLALEPANHEAILILAYNDDYHRGSITDETFSKLSMIESSDKRIISAKLYFQAVYYQESDQQKLKMYLKRSVAAFDGNLRATSRLLDVSPDIEEPEEVAGKALRIAQAYNETEDRQPLYMLSFESFLHNKIFGVKDNFYPIKIRLHKRYRLQ